MENIIRVKSSYFGFVNLYNNKNMNQSELLKLVIFK